MEKVYDEYAWTYVNGWLSIIELVDDETFSVYSTVVPTSLTDDEIELYCDSVAFIYHHR